MDRVSLEEKLDLVYGNHSNPHNVLGQHIEYKVDAKLGYISITAFQPNAKSVVAVDIVTKKEYELEKVHEDGLFYVKTRKRKFFKYRLIITYDTDIKYETYDPYAFLPTFGEMDIHLFSKGCHYEIYEHMGGKFKTIDGIEGVSFVLWAPNASRVSVIGDFNNWDGRVNPMRSLGESGVWELFVPGLKNFDNYKFEIKTHNGDLIEKSDPYANFSELRPSQSSLLFDINGYKWNDEKYMKNRRNSDVLSKPISIYEVHLGSWKRVINENENRFMSYVEACKELIPYVKEMGYTHIELMAISEHPFDGSWGYQVTGYYASTSRFGTPYELMDFINECHKNDLAVIIDWVPGHFVRDEHGLRRFDGTALYEHSDPKRGEHPDWGTLIFNYGRNEVQNFLIGSALYWIEKFHFDGIRIDAVASMLYLDYGKEDGQWIPNEYGGRENFEAIEFLKHMNSIISGKDKSVLLIAEESTSWPAVSRPVEEGGLGFNLKWNMGWMNDTIRYIEKEPIHRKYHHNDLTFSMVYAYTENFILVLSHDEVVHGKGSMIEKVPGDLWQKFANLRNYYGYMFGHPGKKLLFMGQEFGQFDEWNESKSLDWHLLDYDNHKGLQEFYKDLNHLYLSEEALWKYDFTDKGFCWLDANNHEASILAYIRKTDDESKSIIVINNFTPYVHNEYKLWVPCSCTLEEVLNSDNSKYGGSGVLNENEIVSYEENGENYVNVTMPPLGTSFLKIKSR
ncbi:MAG: 1,4-alpha-glucan branching protein GlgB [Lachnospirales bacterium]